MRLSRMARSASLATLATLLFAAPALAQEEGVFIDPDSPSAKEYGIPLESERRQADPEQEQAAGILQGSRTSPLFGAGIIAGGDGDRGGKEKPGSGGSGASPDTTPQDESTEPTTARGGSSDTNEQAARASDGDSEVLRAATSNPGPPDAGVGVPLTIGGMAIAVLLAGGLTGFLLRRRDS